MSDQVKEQQEVVVQGLDPRTNAVTITPSLVFENIQMTIRDLRPAQIRPFAKSEKETREQYRDRVMLLVRMGLKSLLATEESPEGKVPSGTVLSGCPSGSRGTTEGNWAVIEAKGTTSW